MLRHCRDSQSKGDEASDRWYVSARHDGSDKRWESLVDYTAVSDSDYFHDFGSSGLRASSNSQLKQEGRFDYLPDNWRIGVQAKDYQTLSDSIAEPHEVLPSRMQTEIMSSRMVLYSICIMP